MRLLNRKARGASYLKEDVESPFGSRVTRHYLTRLAPGPRVTTRGPLVLFIRTLDEVG